LSNLKAEQVSLFNSEQKKQEGQVTCLGMTFKNDDERRAYFTEELRKKLPELRNVEGFPIGEDKDILALSDPPYYTACPNPWINEFIEEWEKEKVKQYGKDDIEYHREPFASDVSEGKNDPIYNAHSYHTKVPYKAIMRYILHYTNPGDIVLDGFAGTGMTGVAAKMCKNNKVVQQLGYKVDENNSVFDNEEIVSSIGVRKAVLSDLSPIASFIASNYNKSFDPESFKNQALKIIKRLEDEYGWMYETVHLVNDKIQYDEKGNHKTGKVNYVIWSQVYNCPVCTEEIVFWDVAVDNGETVKERFNCAHCGVELNKRTLVKKWDTVYDYFLNKTINQIKQVPVLINYSFGTQRFEKRPGQQDQELLKQIDTVESHEKIPIVEIVKGEKTSELLRQGITHTHHFYTKRNLIALSAFLALADNSSLKYLFSATIVNLGKTARYKFKRSGNVPLSGTIYISSLQAETNVFHALKGKINQIFNMFSMINKKIYSAISTNSTSILAIKENSIDYIFTDPPFGANLMYSDLNFMWESWLGVKTNTSKEAIINKSNNKHLPEYQNLMEMCFREYYRVLKPGHWMTVEFSNSQASVWNSIQEAIQRAGFVLANVSALDKKQGSFNAVMSTTAVKQDLVISAYKPKEEDIRKMKEEQNTEESAWTFVNQHLEQLPIFIGERGSANIIVERAPRILFDRMVAYHVQNGLPVPISSAEFQLGIAQRFPMRDGMAFLESQVAEYDKKRILVKEFSQMSLFVSDENSAIEWLRQQLMKKPQTRQDIHPQFIKEIQHIAKHEELPELDELLEQNFLKYEGNESVPSQLHGYLSTNYKDLRGLEKDDPRLKEKGKSRWYVPDPNKQADLEKLREKTLLREFASYKEEIEKSKKKLKQFRTEAIRTGFKKAWGDKNYETIVKVGERVPEKVLQEDDKLLMYFDNAQIRLGL
jgi:DNA modification methylase